MQILASVQGATLHVNFWEGGEYKGKNSWLPFKSHQIGSRLNWLSILHYLIMKRPFTRYANANDKKWCRILQLRRYSDTQRNRSHLNHQHLTPAHLLLHTLQVSLFLAQQTPPPQWTMASSFTTFLHHTQRRTTVRRTPLEEWSARHRDLYLKAHNINTRQTSMPRWDSNPQSQQASRFRPTP